MKSLLRKLWAVFTWAAFSVGVIALVLMGWSKVRPYLNKRYLESPSNIAQPKDAGTHKLSRIHPEFIQNFNNLVANSGSSDAISALTFDPQNEFLLVGRESGKVDIWDTRLANARREIKAHKQRASNLRFSSDGQVFFTSSYFETVTNVWDTASGELLHTIASARGPVVETSQSNFFVIAGGSELRIFDLKNKDLLPEKYSSASGVATAITYDLLTDHLAIGTASGGLEIWKFNSNQGHPALEKVAAARPYEMGNQVVGVKFFNKGNSLYSIPQRGPIDEWSTRPFEKLRSRKPTLTFSSSPIFVPERSLLAMAGFVDTSTYAGFLEILNLETGSDSMIDLKENGSGVIAYLPSLSTVISANGSSISFIDVSKAK
jgi:WD40 repeat protein